MTADFDDRVRGAIHDLFTLMQKRGATLHLQACGRDYHFDDGRIIEAAKRTGSAVSETEREFSGRLIGFLPTDRRFELATETRVIKGKLAADVDTESIAGWFGKSCVAHLRITSVPRPSGLTEAFSLLEIREAD